MKMIRIRAPPIDRGQEYWFGRALIWCVLAVFQYMCCTVCLDGFVIHVERSVKELFTAAVVAKKRVKWIVQFTRF